MTQTNSAVPTGKGGKAFFDRADQVAETGNWDFAIELYIEGIQREPGNIQRGHQPLREVALKRTASGGKPAGFMEKHKPGGKKRRQPTGDGGVPAGQGARKRRAHGGGGQGRHRDGSEGTDPVDQRDPAGVAAASAKEQEEPASAGVPHAGPAQHPGVPPGDQRLRDRPRAGPRQPGPAGNPRPLDGHRDDPAGQVRPGRGVHQGRQGPGGAAEAHRGGQARAERRSTASRSRTRRGPSTSRCQRFPARSTPTWTRCWR